MKCVQNDKIAEIANEEIKFKVEERGCYILYMLHVYNKMNK